MRMPWPMVEGVRTLVSVETETEIGQEKEGKESVNMRLALGMSVAASAAVVSAAPAAVPRAVTAAAAAHCTATNNCSPQTFAEAILAYPGIGAPVNGPNLYAMKVWERAEGGGAGCPGQPPHTAPWSNSRGPAGNPLGTTQPEPGSTNWNSIGVKVYHNTPGHTCWYWGIKANGDTLENGHYGNVIAALRSPATTSRDQCIRLARAVGNSPWGTGDFERFC
jgi:hypothetical protein